MRPLLLSVLAALLLAAPAAARTGHLSGYADSDRCDPLDPSLCLYPWPNDQFTKRDRTTATGLRLDLERASMPRNTDGTPIDPTEQDRNDGFSPGSAIITRVPGLDTPQAFRRSKLVPITDMARAFDRDQPAVLINTRTHKRTLIWTELDANPKARKDVTLIIRPGRNLDEGTRYVVALRHLRNARGRTLRPTRAFRFYRDRIATKPRNAAFEARRPHMERIFRDLKRAHIARHDLYLAWDFTVASERNLSERELHIRNAAFAKLGDRDLGNLRPEGRSPRFTIDSVEDFTPEQDPLIARKVRGHIDVPCYLDKPGCPPGAQFRYANKRSTIPVARPGNTARADFVCNIPRAAFTRPARPGVYGHGLLGSPDEIDQAQLKAMSQEHDFVFCGTPWIGMAREDIPNVAGLLTDLSRFASLPDRVQQGFVDFMYLGRAMIRPDGLISNSAFQTADGRPVLDISAGRAYYDGNSQGGILGGGLAAVAPDWNRAVLGVPGMNFSTLLRRSVDFNTYAAILYKAYPDELERPLILGLLQLLWDRAEADGYAEHMTTDPYPDTPPHHVLMHVAFGDHQVANVTADVEARTIGAATLPQPLKRGRSPDVTPLLQIPRITTFPYDGSAIVYWDSGTPPPPTTNVPNERGTDPHETPRNQKAAREQKSTFLRPDGKVIDVCGGAPCTAVDPE